MDFRYPYPDWLEACVVVRGEFGLDLDTKFGEVTVPPWQFGDTVVLATYLEGCLVYSAMPGALWDERDLCIRERLRRY